MRTYLRKKYDCSTGLSYWKFKVKTRIKQPLTNEEVFELEEIIETYLNNIEKQ
jgi:hypothetical protein